MSKWSPAEFSTVIKLLGECDSGHINTSGLDAINSALGERITKDQLRHRFDAAGLDPPSRFCKDRLGDSVVEVEEPEQTETSELLEKILYSVRHRPMTFIDVADKLRVPIGDVKAEIGEAIGNGFDLHVNDGYVSRARRRVHSFDGDEWRAGVGWHSVGLISDTHLGNIWCCGRELTAFIRWAHASGVRTIIHSGDVLDGVKDVLRPEQSHCGFDAQSDEALRIFPQLDGLRYYSQTGNHDEYTSDACGFDAGRALENKFRALGRDDWHHVGRCGSVIRVESATWELCHPHGGTGSNSGVLGVLESIVNERHELPDFMLTGHFHKYVYGIRKGCHMIGVPAWQQKGSPFSNRIKGPWAVGGLIVQYHVDDAARVDAVSTRFMSADRFVSEVA